MWCMVTHTTRSLDDITLLDRSHKLNDVYGVALLMTHSLLLCN